MSKQTPDVTVVGFKARTSQFLAAASEAATRWYDSEGQWVAETTPAATRERFWLCFALYANGKASLADAIISRAELSRSDGVYFDIFETNIAAALLVQHRDKMAADVRAKLELPVRDGFTFKADRRPDFQFHGYNDNMPAKSSMGLILGGELLGDEASVEHGLWNLRRFTDQLTRNSINSEYNSPTYSPLTIHGLAEIASFAASEEARELALQLEQKLWLDVARRFHPEMGVVAGPHSRAYTADTLAHQSILASLLWFVLGDIAKPSPMGLFDEHHEYVLHHTGDVPFNVAQMCWLAAGHYHVPDEAAVLIGAKEHPYEFCSTSEQGDAGPDFPARRVLLNTYLAPDFTVGTVSSPFTGGEQTMSYFATYKKKSEVDSFKDVGTVFSKLVVNDHEPGTVPPSKFANSGEQDNLDNRANTIALQSGPTALVLTHPHLALGGVDEGGIRDLKPTPLRRLSEMVIFPAHFGAAEEIWADGEFRTEWSGEIAAGQWVGCRRGRLLVGVFPLAYTAEGKCPLTLEKINRYELLRASLYRGEEKVFSRYELRNIFGGFIAEHASVDEFGSLAEFMTYLQEAKVLDYYWAMRTVGYHRPAGAHRPALDLMTAYSPGAVAPRFATVNGRDVWEKAEAGSGELVGRVETLPYPELRAGNWTGVLSEKGS